MTGTRLRITRGFFGMLVAGTLGFGAREALASPAAREVAYCTRQDQSYCYEHCSATYGEGYRAGCTKDSFGFIECSCYQVATSG